MSLQVFPRLFPKKKKWCCSCWGTWNTSPARHEVFTAPGMKAFINWLQFEALLCCTVSKRKQTNTQKSQSRPSNWETQLTWSHFLCLSHVKWFLHCSSCKTKLSCVYVLFLRQYKCVTLRLLPPLTLTFQHSWSLCALKTPHSRLTGPAWGVQSPVKTSWAACSLTLSAWLIFNREWVEYNHNAAQKWKQQTPLSLLLNRLLTGARGCSQSAVRPENPEC